MVRCIGVHCTRRTSISQFARHNIDFDLPTVHNAAYAKQSLEKWTTQADGYFYLLLLYWWLSEYSEYVMRRPWILQCDEYEFEFGIGRQIASANKFLIR